MPNRYFFEGRNTGIIANSAAEARKKKKRGGDKIVATHRNITPPKNGAWDRTRRDNKSPAKSAYGKGRGQGPARKKS